MKLIIERFDGTTHYKQAYKLNPSDIKGKTLLSVLIFIKQTQDVTLNFTASCRSAICGACGVRVNGHAVLACDVKMEDLLKTYDNPSVLHISPLANFRVISDLVVDWEPSIENIRKIHPTLIAKDEFSSDKGCVQTPEQSEKIKKQWDCILCGCCASECNKLAADSSDYMEPFVFTRAYRAAADSRSKDPMVHVKASVMGGLWNCVHCQECFDRCPKGISAADDIANLRVMALKHGLKDGEGPAHAIAFYTDLVEGSGRLNEILLALRSEGVATVGKTDIALKLMGAGKMNPMHIFGEDEIQGHKELVEMIKAAQAASKE
ncbi:8-methylmenaquinol:fumarate reductase iron-sulfur subunit [Campylobacter sp.]|uniref:8-methylmenaquinol:fumarate reductase iron-sulfur subunit n=1 Tax=Campylobacter sp. TaxID=205 RepID=UPI002703035A|nr:succinate dehydrogenase/fumarate reductase iron-sulfur subunit [Campylobacter sp.]